MEDRNISCGYCRNYGYPVLYRYDRLYSNITEWIPEYDNSSTNNEDFWSSGKGVIIILVAGGMVFAMILILLFRKSIWTSSESKVITQQSLISDEGAMNS